MFTSRTLCGLILLCKQCAAASDSGRAAKHIYHPGGCLRRDSGMDVLMSAVSVRESHFSQNKPCRASLGGLRLFAQTCSIHCLCGESAAPVRK